MKGDFSRFTHIPNKHYTGVLKQQGRVDLDADWNEYIDIQAHLEQIERKDVIGYCGVPKHAAGFQISPRTRTDGDFTISPGRIYVDGILCELEPAPAATTYGTQPDYPNAPGLKIANNRTDLVYLDVWERHITAVEDPDIREVALGGADTTTRVKTVWQVRVQTNVGDGVDCIDEIQGWPPAPSGGFLSSREVSVPQSEDPCIIEPGSGYTGLENRLYRVEIHKGGNAGTATFKWSRDNGSVVFPIEGFQGTDKVKVKSLGRDQVLALHEGDWVEVIGDETELKGEPGTLVQILPGGIDEAERVLTLSGNVSRHSLEGHAKVRRWDQRSDAIPITSGFKPLEDGVEIEFTGNNYKTGDYWVFAARTATGKVERLVNAEPHGIRHHYCRLALVTWRTDQAGNATSATVALDCRKHFPPLTELPTGGEDCCTVTVGDGVRSVGDFTDIQEAIKSLQFARARVCILPGEYKLQETVTIRTGNVIVGGCGYQSLIEAPDDLPAFRVEDAEHVTLESMIIRAHSPESAIVVVGSSEARVADCIVINLNQDIVRLRAPAGPALMTTDSAMLTVVNNTLVGSPSVSIRGQVARIAGNRLIGGGVWVRDGSAMVLIHDNDISDGQGAIEPRGPGIALGGLGPEESPSDRATGVSMTKIVGNQIQRMEASGIATFPTRQDDDRNMGDIEDLTIAHNWIVACSRESAGAQGAQAGGGIVLSKAARVSIHDNYISENGIGRTAACGIFVSECLGLEITDNRILNNGSIDEDETGVYQAGIVAVDVFSGSAIPLGTPTISPLAGPVGIAFRPEQPAALVHNNVVVCPKGHALIVDAFGQVSVIGNILTSHGLRKQPLTHIALERLAGGCVLIWNRGRISGWALLGIPPGFWSNATVHYPPLGLTGFPFLGLQGFPEGRVMFSDNQVTLQAFSAPVDEVQYAITVLIISDDDVALNNNQILTELPGQLVFTSGLVKSVTARALGNRFTELPGGAILSYLSLAAHMNLTTDNQATHCIVTGGTQKIERDNQVMVSANCPSIISHFARP